MPGPPLHPDERERFERAQVSRVESGGRGLVRQAAASSLLLWLGVWLASGSWLSLGVALIPWWVALVVRGRPPVRAPRGGPVGAGPLGLFVAGQRVFPRGKMARAEVRPQGEGAVVELVAQVTEQRVRVEGLSRDEAERLAATLGLSEHRPAEYAVGRPTARGAAVLGAWWAAAASVAIVRGVEPALVGSLACLGALPFLLFWPESVLLVGLDGLLLRRGRRERAIGYREIRAVEVLARSVEIELRSGETLRLTTGGSHHGRHGEAHEPEPEPEPEPEHEAKASTAEQLAGRIRRAVEASRAPQPPSLSALSRGGDEPGAWLSRVRGSLGRQGHFREEAPSPDRLWEAAVGQGAPDELRAAAAAALAPQLDREGRGRLRLVADAVVSPGLRSAIRAAADEDDERLLEALASLERAPGAGASEG